MMFDDDTGGEGDHDPMTTHNHHGDDGRPLQVP